MRTGLVSFVGERSEDLQVRRNRVGSVTSSITLAYNVEPECIHYVDDDDNETRVSDSETVKGRTDRAGCHSRQEGRILPSVSSMSN